MIPTASVCTRTVSLGTCFSNAVVGLIASTGSDSPDSSNNRNGACSADMHKILPKNVLRVYKIRPKNGQYSPSGLRICFARIIL